MWTRTRVTDILGIALPIVQGPFGGRYAPPALVAAVSNAGALGGFGAVNMPSDEIRGTAAAIRALTNRPFAINAWLPIPGQDDAPVSASAFERSLVRLRPFLRASGLAEPQMPAQYGVAFADQLAAILDARPSVFSFIMGVPDAAILRDFKARGTTTMGTATTVDEAVAIAEAGADIVVVSGSEAGGHRGSFLRPPEVSAMGTMALVPQVASAVPIPVIAAGGIADGRGIAAALALGAEGVQIGTAFVACPESGAPAVHKQRLGQPSARWTRLTRAFSGRQARGLENDFMRALDPHEADLLPFPMQSWLTAPLRSAAATRGDAELIPLWAGQCAALARAMPAAELVATLVAETDEVLRSTRMVPNP